MTDAFSQLKRLRPQQERAEQDAMDFEGDLIEHHEISLADRDGSWESRRIELEGSKQMAIDEKHAIDREVARLEQGQHAMSGPDFRSSRNELRLGPKDLEYKADPPAPPADPAPRTHAELQPDRHLADGRNEPNTQLPPLTGDGLPDELRAGDLPLPPPGPLTIDDIPDLDEGRLPDAPAQPSAEPPINAWELEGATSAPPPDGGDRAPLHEELQGSRVAPLRLGVSLRALGLIGAVAFALLLAVFIAVGSGPARSAPSPAPAAAAASAPAPTLATATTVAPATVAPRLDGTVTTSFGGPGSAPELCFALAADSALAGAPWVATVTGEGSLAEPARKEGRMTADSKMATGWRMAGSGKWDVGIVVTAADGRTFQTSRQYSFGAGGNPDRPACPRT